MGLFGACLYYLLPAWIIAGIADWLWHKQTEIERTPGLKESVILALMFTEIGIPTTLRARSQVLLSSNRRSYLHRAKVKAGTKRLPPFISLSWDCDTCPRRSEAMPESDGNEGSNIPFLAGEVYALTCFAQILANTSDQPQTVLKHLSFAEQVGLSDVETKPVPDDVMAGFQFAIGKVRDALGAASERQSNARRS